MDASSGEVGSQVAGGLAAVSAFVTGTAPVVSVSAGDAGASPSVDVDAPSVDVGDEPKSSGSRLSFGKLFGSAKRKVSKVT